MSGTEIEPTTPLLVTLPARQWSSLLTAAGEGLNALASIINEVQQQCMQASKAESERMPVPPRKLRPNGEANA